MKNAFVRVSIAIGMILTLNGCMRSSQISGFDYDDSKPARIEAKYMAENSTRMVLMSVDGHDISLFDLDVAVPPGEYKLVYDCYGNDVSTSCVFCSTSQKTHFPLVKLKLLLYL